MRGSATGLSTDPAELAGALRRFGLDNYTPLFGNPHSPVTVVAQDIFEGRRILLKEAREYLGEGEFRLHVALHDHVRRAGGPVPQPLAIAGKAVLSDSGGRLAEVQCWVEGRTLATSSPDDLAAAGAALARFHAAAADFADRSAHAEPRERLAKAAAYRRHLERARTEEGQVDALYDRLARAARETSRVEGPLAKPQILHGDPAPSNFLVLPDGSVLLVDLDDAHEAAPIGDLAWLLCLTSAFCWRPGHVPDFGIRGAWDATSFSAVMQGYCAAANIARTRITTLKPWLCASIVCAVTDCFVDGGEPENAREMPRVVAAALDLIDEMASWQGESPNE